MTCGYTSGITGFVNALSPGLRPRLPPSLGLSPLDPDDEPPPAALPLLSGDSGVLFSPLPDDGSELDDFASASSFSSASVFSRSVLFLFSSSDNGASGSKNPLSFCFCSGAAVENGEAGGNRPGCLATVRVRNRATESRDGIDDKEDRLLALGALVGMLLSTATRGIRLYRTNMLELGSRVFNMCDEKSTFQNLVEVRS